MLATKRNEGFTLIELMITVAIIGILASTAVSLFFDQQLRAKRAEAMTQVESLAKMERGYYGEFGQYTQHVPMPGPVPGTKSRPWSPAAAAVYSGLGFAPEGNVYFDYGVNAGCCVSGNCFTAEAYGDLDGANGVSVIAYFHADGAGNDCPTQVLGYTAFDPSMGVNRYDEVFRHPLANQY